MDYLIEILFISRIFLMFVAERFMRVFFDKRTTRFPVMALSYLAFPIGLNATTALLLFLNLQLPAIFIIILDVVPTAALLFVITLNYKGTWKKRLVAAFSIVAIGITINYVVAILLGAHIAPLGDPIPRQSTAHFLVEMIASLFFSLIVALLLQNFKNIRKNVAILPIVWVSVLAIPLSSIVVVFIVGHAPDISTPAQILVLCLIFGINVLVFYLHDRLSAASEARLQSALYAREKEYYLSQCQLMQESMEQTKSIRHDMKAHLATAQGLAAKAGADKAADYLGGLLDDMDAVKIYSNTGNVVFDSIINFKLRNAERENIQPAIRLLIPPSLNVETSDLAVILGNLLDNALDAVARVEEKKIRLEVNYSRETLFILIENPFDGVVKYMRGDNAAESGAGEKRLPVTRKPGDDHGYGLRNIRRALEKYDGHMDVAIEGNIFSVSVLLYVDGSVLTAA